MTLGPAASWPSVRSPSVGRMRVRNLLSVALMDVASLVSAGR